MSATASSDEVWLVDFGEPFPGEPAHHRPAVVVGPDALFRGAIPQVILVPLTTRRRGLANHIEVDATGVSGLDVVSYAQCELVRSVGSRRLVHRLGTVSLGEAGAIRYVLAALLGTS
jgi:mRNA interferase MazF